MKNFILFFLCVSIIYGQSEIPKAEDWHWVKHDNNPVLTIGEPGSWDDFVAYLPTVLKIDGIYHLWYEGARETTNAKIGYATSSDGINWEKYTGNPVLV